MSFALDPRLAADTHLIGDFLLSKALLMDDARYPWVILVPRRASVVEITDLDATARGALMEEITLVAATIRAWPGVEKINFGALGNKVRQLHVHIVGRNSHDAAWPGPVWGQGAATSYEPAMLESRLAWLANKLAMTRPADTA